MTAKTIARIIHNSIANRADTVIGRYTYRATPNGEIYRCPTVDTGRSWIDSDGNRSTAWERIYPTR